MKLLCKIGLHIYKSIDKTVNGHGQIIKTHKCRCGRKRTDISWILFGEAIVEEWSYYTNSNDSVVEETEPKKLIRDGNRYVDLS